MKRKQKTPRRIRPSGSPDVDSGNTPTPISSKLGEKMEAETQTENADTIKSRVPNTSKPRSETRFRNEQGSSDMPLILNVFSLSDASPCSSKQLDVVSKQENSFPVTPPCSPPLIQLGAFKSIPVMRQNSQVPKRSANLCGYMRDNTQMYNRNSVPTDPRAAHFVYEPAEQMVNNSSHLIANGVLPVATHNAYGQQAYADINNPRNGYFNGHVSNSSEAPISQLTNMFNISGNKYLVSKESFVTKGSSSLYTRFKLQHDASASDNRQPNECVSLAGEFPPKLTKNAPQYIDPINDISSKRFSYAAQEASGVNGQTNRSDIRVGREAFHSSNSVIPTNNLNKCSQSYSGFQQGYGHTKGLHTQTPAVAPTGDLNASRVSFISNPAPCGPAKGQSWDTDQALRIATSSGDESSDFLSPRDARVQRLKRQLEEQEAKLKRLRTSY